MVLYSDIKQKNTISYDLKVFDLDYAKAIVIDDLYSEKEYTQMLNECKFLEPNLKSPRESGSAQDLSGALLKKNKADFLDSIYANPQYSNLFRYSKKIVNSDIFEKIVKIHPNYVQFFDICNENTPTGRIGHLLSYYENSDYYAPHKDECVFTILTWLFEEPKAFEGGNIILDNKCEIECKPNRILIFNSWIEHEVTPISMTEDKLGKGLGRFTYSQFYNF